MKSSIGRLARVQRVVIHRSDLLTLANGLERVGAPEAAQLIDPYFGKPPGSLPALGELLAAMPHSVELEFRKALARVCEED